MQWQFEAEMVIACLPYAFPKDYLLLFEKSLLKLLLRFAKG